MDLAGCAHKQAEAAAHRATKPLQQQQQQQQQQNQTQVPQNTPPCDGFGWPQVLTHMEKKEKVVETYNIHIDVEKKSTASQACAQWLPK